MFSGGTYDEVGRWLWNFVTSHGKRVNPRAEVIVDTGEDRTGRSYGVHMRLGARQSTLWEIDYPTVAENRGNLDWCRRLAEKVRDDVRGLASSAEAAVRRAE